MPQCAALVVAMGDTSRRYAGGREIHDLFREIFMTHAALTRIMDRVHEQAGLSTSQHKIMRCLIGSGPATVPDMAAALGVSRQFVQTVCNHLASRGSIEFTPNPRHKRSKLVAATEAGRAAFRQARDREDAIIANALPTMDAEKVTDACQLMGAVRAALAQVPEET